MERRKEPRTRSPRAFMLAPGRVLEDDLAESRRPVSLILSRPCAFCGRCTSCGVPCSTVEAVLRPYGPRMDLRPLFGRDKYASIAVELDSAEGAAAIARESMRRWIEDQDEAPAGEILLFPARIDGAPLRDRERRLLALLLEGVPVYPKRWRSEELSPVAEALGFSSNDSLRTWLRRFLLRLGIDPESVRKHPFK